MQLLEVAADRYGLVDHGAVVEDERRQQGARIDGAELGGDVLAARDINLLGVDLDALLGEENPYAPGVWCLGEIVELHSLIVVAVRARSIHA